MTDFSTITSSTTLPQGEAIIDNNFAEVEIRITRNANNPEGVRTGTNIGQIYEDTSNGHAYIKTSATGNTGWKRLLDETIIPKSYTTGDILYASSSNVIGKLGIGSNGQYLSITEGTPAWVTIPETEIPADPFSERLLHIQDQKSANTAAQTLTSGAWRTRDLNTILTNEITGASLTSNVITLPVGTYFCVAKVPCSAVQDVKSRLRKTNGTAADLLLGDQCYNNNTYSVGTPTFIFGRFTLTEISDIEVQMWVTVTGTGGRHVNIDSKNEIYTDIMVWKVG